MIKTHFTLRIVEQNHHYLTKEHEQHCNLMEHVILGDEFIKIRSGWLTLEASS